MKLNGFNETTSSRYFFYVPFAKRKKSFLHNALFACGYYKIAPQISCLWTQARPPTYTQSEYIIFCQLEFHLQNLQFVCQVGSALCYL